MLKAVEISIDGAASKKLAKTLDAFVDQFRLSQLAELPPGSRYTLHMMEYAYTQAAKALHNEFGDGFIQALNSFGNGDADVMVIKGVPYDERFADFSPGHKRGMPYSDFFYFGLARQLGAMSHNDLRLDFVRDGFDDNLHQDGAYQAPGYDYKTYGHTSFLALTCLHPGEKKAFPLW